MLPNYGFGDAWILQRIDDESLFVESFVQHIKDCYKQEWHCTLHDMSKMSAYCTFKTVFKPNIYIYIERVFKYYKISKCAFRISMLKPKPGD